MIQLTIILFWLYFRRGLGSGSGNWMRDEESKGKKQEKRWMKNINKVRKQKGMKRVTKSGRELPAAKVKFL